MLKTTGHNTWFVFVGIPSSGRCVLSDVVTVVSVIIVVAVLVTVVVLVLTVFAIIFLSFREKSLWQADLKKGAKT